MGRRREGGREEREGGREGGRERGRREEEGYTRNLLCPGPSLPREKQLLVGGDNFGRDLTSVQKLQKKHQRIEDELRDREARIGAVLSQGKELTLASHYARTAIQEQCSKLQDMWEELNTASTTR